MKRREEQEQEEQLASQEEQEFPLLGTCEAVSPLACSCGGPEREKHQHTGVLQAGATGWGDNSAQRVCNSSCWSCSSLIRQKR